MLSFGVTLGVAAVLINHVLDYPGADPSTPVPAFAFGVLLDTIVTSSILVPAIVADVGDRIWWPGDCRMAADEREPEVRDQSRSVS
ncbi:hypothetical protein [Janibacter cremeus]|uniref:Putative membrane protein YdfJ with MMPL/SSD domain n=1 Tax=Janibacter cremeus TaxID=1285192 RepID=A0A852VXV7_9MICO|nr:putative membrane protein YdfJ with MMPL/SSD domain [Janibacter cremeus]